MAHSLTVCSLDVHQLAAIVRNRIDNALILDSRSFLEYNASHIINAVNVGCAKLMKRRLQQEKLCIEDFLAQNCHWDVDRSIDIIVYDQNTRDAKYLSPDSFMAVFLQKLLPVYNSVNILKGGFLEFQAAYPHLCEDERTKCAPLTSLSQPCLPVSNHGPTRIMPFLYLGSQNDALNKEVLQHYNITYQLNVSTSCPKPDFIQESHFMRIPVIDNYSEKLLPHFPNAFQFLEKVRESGGCVLVHCLAGISRSATVAISYVMKSLKITSDEAYRYVKAKRPTISPNFNFLGQLLEYEKQLQRELVLGLKSETTSTPMFSTSSLSYERRCSTETKHFSQELLPDSYCVKYADVAEITSTVGSSTHFESSKTTECLVTCEQTITAKLDTYTSIPQKHTTALNIKCLPVSSLRELSFTPCQTSTFKSMVKAEKNLTKCLSRNSATSPTAITSSKGSDKNYLTEIRLNMSQDLTSPGDLKTFEFDSKSYNRSDSVSTSGLGSEGSDYADSWNEYTSSCERETDILMDDDYPVVPTGEDMHGSKRMGSFEDSYEDSLSLYPKYESLYNPCRMQHPTTRDYLQTDSTNNAKKPNWKYEESYKHPGSQRSAVIVEDLGRAQLLYRAQSCPGMLSSESSSSSSTDNGVKLRKSKLAKSSKDNINKNRYSCSSIDYMDYTHNVSLSHESCPDVLHLSADGSKKYTSHCSYRHSMIQVS